MVSDFLSPLKGDGNALFDSQTRKIYKKNFVRCTGSSVGDIIASTSERFSFIPYSLKDQYCRLSFNTTPHEKNHSQELGARRMR
jgi:hypothetical protein